MIKDSVATTIFTIRLTIALCVLFFSKISQYKNQKIVKM